MDIFIIKYWILVLYDYEIPDYFQTFRNLWKVCGLSHLYATHRFTKQNWIWFPMSRTLIFVSVQTSWHIFKVFWYCLCVRQFGIRHLYGNNKMHDITLSQYVWTNRLRMTSKKAIMVVNYYQYSLLVNLGLNGFMNSILS